MWRSAEHPSPRHATAVRITCYMGRTLHRFLSYKGITWYLAKERQSLKSLLLLENSGKMTCRDYATRQKKRGDMEESGGNSQKKLKREQDAKRQGAYRKRKKEKGKYVNLFVSQEIARKIKGKPALLVERFVELPEVMDRLEEQEKEIAELRSQREKRRISLSLKFENALIEKRFGESGEKDLLERANDERRRLAELLAEERNERDRLMRRVYAIVDAAGPWSRSWWTNRRTTST